MTDNVDPHVADTPEQAKDKPCVQCLVPEIMTAWNSARGACEFVPNETERNACRKEMEEIAKDVKSIKKGSEIIYMAIKSSSNPSAFIQAQIDFAKTHNAANTEAILKWADEMESAGKTLPEDVAKIVKFYRIQSGSQI
jgi:DNA-binding phage protein